MSNKLIVTASPHIHDSATTSTIMRDVLIGLAPAMVAAVIIFGFRALLLTAVCAAACVIFEYATERVLGRENTISDLSAVVTGVILSFNLPVQLPLWMAVVGCFFAIVIVKQLFGGIGNNFANPAIAARIFLLLSFSQPMTSWLSVENGHAVQGVYGATPLAQIAAGETDALPSLLEMFLGLRGGCMGETCALALIIGGIYLIWRKVITPTIPLSFIGGVLVLSLLFGVDPMYQLLGGGLMIGAFFMATDYTTSPITEKGKIIFGLGCALITMVIRVFGSYPEGVSYSILLMNIITPHINRMVRNKAFGGVQQ
ncbi:RnfABCDGE type electron transport complex subunit D [uncultured Negativibacillus sp.]|uniref:RnfABCDGE type electron transport complex subunit D n=1 Tax=uncultured Negativibacillus sp. TaxID=1980696 RepID=UPI0025D3F8C2|nr:RnfABCDGE type electron transport complex subunit D [uncultured Negativibacillus sp.]